METCKQVFSETGPLVNVLENYSPRKEQLALATKIEEVLESNQVLIGEAGTGVGKSLAYLVPVLLSGKHTIISTGTKHLQDQLFYKDVPIVKKALGTNTRISMLKGRKNYLCLHRMDMARHNFLTRLKEYADQLNVIENWSYKTKVGEITEISDVKEDSQIWPLVTSTTDNCIGQECPSWDDCFVVKARKKAQKSDVVIVNHHLFLADLALKDEGFGEILPNAQAYIMDEAHQLPEIAVNFFSTRISNKHITELCRDSIAEQLNEAPEMMEIRLTCEDIEANLKKVRLQLGEQNAKKPWGQIVHKPSLKVEMVGLINHFEKLKAQLEIGAEQGKGLENCLERCCNLLEFLNKFNNLQFEDRILWFESWNNGFAFYATPYEIDSFFKKKIEQQLCSWVFTSATLSVDKNFNHFKQQMGIDGVNELILNSPFDYKNNARLYIPNDLPLPSANNYHVELFKQSRKIIKAAKGRTFFLFTSYRSLNAAADYFENYTDFNVFVQGRDAKMKLIENFKKTDNAILLATSSFWEGVDIRGQALTCVIIEKLPFASPGDPVLKARLDYIQKNGGNAFMDYQVPQAIISLKQGAGRLIRDYSDKGLLMLCDSRLVTKPYGKLFVNSLNAMPKVKDSQQAEAFLETL